MFPIGPGASDVPRARKSAKEIARRHTLRAIKRINSLIDAESEAVQLGAANAILDRGWGKPSQHMEVEGKLTLEALVTTSMKVDDTDGS
jgi:hypothetical protein